MGRPCVKGCETGVILGKPSLSEPTMRSLAAATAMVLSGFLLPGSIHGLPTIRCSLVPGFHPGHGERLVLMLARPLQDTLHAGPGDIEQGEGEGHSGNGQRGRIYGQRFEVARSGGLGATGLNEMSQAVLVPWDYDAACRPVPWARSARWSQATDTVLYAVPRRETKDWGNGIPTFDISPVSQSIYSGQSWQADGFEFEIRPDTTTPVSTPVELFDFLIRAPRSDQVLSGDERALDEINAWAFANPEVASRRPIAPWLDGIRTRLRTAQLMTQPVPFLGTWRVTLRLRSGREVVRYFRTEDKPFIPWNEGSARVSTAASGPDGLHILFNWAAAEQALPTEYQHEPAHWGMNVASRSPSTERHWKFAIIPEEFGTLGNDIPEVKQLIGEYYKRVLADSVFREHDVLHGEIVLLAGDHAVLRIGWDADGDGKDDMVMTGERVSRVTAPEPASWPKFQRW